MFSFKALAGTGEVSELRMGHLRKLGRRSLTDMKPDGDEAEVDRKKKDEVVRRATVTASGEGGGGGGGALSSNDLREQIAALRRQRDAGGVEETKQAEALLASDSDGDGYSEDGFEDDEG